VVVKTLSGRTIVVDVGPSDTIADLKHILAAGEGIPTQSQRLFCGSKELTSGIVTAIVQPGVTVTLLLGLAGGAAPTTAGPSIIVRLTYIAESFKEMTADDLSGWLAGPPPKASQANIAALKAAGTDGAAFLAYTKEDFKEFLAEKGAAAGLAQRALELRRKQLR
jgi:hypothetical protein